MPSNSDLSIDISSGVAGCDGKLRTKDLTGAYPPSSHTYENFDGGRFIHSTRVGIAGTEEQYYIYAHTLHSSGTGSLDADTVTSTGTYSLKCEHAAFAPNPGGNGPLGKGDPAVGRVWVSSQRKEDGELDRNYYAHEYTKDARDAGTAGTSGEWPFGLYNRIRLWIKLSPNITDQAIPYFQQLDIGTYTRAGWGSINSQEEGGWHYYHKFNIFHAPVWQQVILDNGLHAVRSGVSDIVPIDSGTVAALGDPYDGTQWESDIYNVNYFDRMTDFYIDYGDRGDHDPDTTGGGNYIMLDEIEFYYEPEDEADVNEVVGMSGFYDPAVDVNGRLYVAWSGNRMDPDYGSGSGTLDHESVYSFSDIHAGGWDSGTATPDSPHSNGSQRDMRIDTTAIDMGSNDVIYIAIRPVGKTKFRQISIPLTQAGYDTVVAEKR